MTLEVVPVAPSTPVPPAAYEVTVGTILFWLVALGVALAAYLIPTIVASHRGHPQRRAIIVLNIVAGWSVLGWIAALVWSATAFRRETA